jgi:hypothetical protein
MDRGLGVWCGGRARRRGAFRFWHRLLLPRRAVTDRNRSGRGERAIGVTHVGQSRLAHRPRRLPAWQLPVNLSTGYGDACHCQRAEAKLPRGDSAGVIGIIYFGVINSSMQIGIIYLCGKRVTDSMHRSALSLSLLSLPTNRAVGETCQLAEIARILL